jgi:hypothetical protein
VAATTSPSRPRLRTFRILTEITALLILLALPNLLAPWLDVNLNPAIHHPEVERWHTAVEGAGDACAFVVLVALLWRPAANPLAAASLALSVAVSAVMVLPFTGPSLLFILLPVALIAVTYPYWGLLRGIRRQDLRPVRPCSLSPCSRPPPWPRRWPPRCSTRSRGSVRRRSPISGPPTPSAASP